jgi:hypothetical protein
MRISSYKHALIAILFLIVFTTLKGQVVFNDLFDGTMLRIDYVYAGNNNSDNIFIKKLNIHERWSGHPNALIDKQQYGDHLVEIIDSKGIVVFSKSFSSLFKEWKHTDEAAIMKKSISESVTVPNPKQTVTIRISARSLDMSWKIKNEFKYEPQNATITKHKARSFSYDSLLYYGKPSEKVDIAIIPEGYASSEMDKFQQDCKALTDTLFSWSPFSLFKESFNVWLVNAPSEESGTDIPDEDIWRNTRFNSSFNTFGSSRYLMITEIDRLHDAAAGVPYDIIYVLVNSEKYGGGAIYNQINLCSSDHPLSGFVFMHELGHGLVGLADEYVDTTISYQNIYDMNFEPSEPNITTLVEFDRKWKNMIPPTIPIPTDASQKYKGVIGAFEGAGYVEKGIYRPMQHCSMRERLSDGFCPVCQSEIIKTITLYTNP